jgi:hypothetical protein
MNYIICNDGITFEDLNHLSSYSEGRALTLEHHIERTNQLINRRIDQLHQPPKLINHVRPR